MSKDCIEDLDLETAKKLVLGDDSRAEEFFLHLPDCLDCRVRWDLAMSVLQSDPDFQKAIKESDDPMMAFCRSLPSSVVMPFTEEEMAELASEELTPEEEARMEAFVEKAVGMLQGDTSRTAVRERLAALLDKVGETLGRVKEALVGEPLRWIQGFRDKMSLSEGIASVGVGEPALETTREAIHRWLQEGQEKGVSLLQLPGDSLQATCGFCGHRLKLGPTWIERVEKKAFRNGLVKLDKFFVDCPKCGLPVAVEVKLAAPEIYKTFSEKLPEELLPLFLDHLEKEFRMIPEEERRFFLEEIQRIREER